MIMMIEYASKSRASHARESFLKLAISVITSSILAIGKKKLRQSGQPIERLIVIDEDVKKPTKQTNKQNSLLQVKSTYHFNGCRGMQEMGAMKKANLSSKN